MSDEPGSTFNKNHILYPIRSLYFSSPQQAIEECVKGAFEKTSSEEDRTHGVNKEYSSRSRGAGCPVKQACRYLTSQHTRLFLLHLLKISHIRSTYSRAVRSLPPSHSLRVFDKLARLAASHVSPSVLVCLFGWKKIASDGRSLGRSVGCLHVP